MQDQLKEAGHNLSTDTEKDLVDIFKGILWLSNCIGEMDSDKSFHLLFYLLIISIIY